jgi:enoyl-CoA hydratase/carnithine racemase
MSDRHPDGQVTTEARGRLYLIGLDRAEKYNGLTPKMFEELTAAYNELENNDALRVGILFAHGKHFTAGLDLPRFREHMKMGERPYRREGEVDFYALRRRCSKPIVAAVHGITFTAGIEMMLATDIVVAASDCRFSQLEAKRGIMAGGGATFRFVQRAGWGNAMYHLLTCDEFNAQEALRCGFVQEVVEPGKQLDRAIEIAEQIARMAPLAVRATKSNAARYLRDGEAACIGELEDIQRRLSNTEDAAEGVKSFVERRDPAFQGK